MLRTTESGGLFFSVTYTTSIGGVNHFPSVCYRLSGDLRPTVEGMVKEGLAKIYDGEVRFVSGVPYPVKKTVPPREEPPAPLPSFAPTSSSAPSGKRGKKPSRDGFVS